MFVKLALWNYAVSLVGFVDVTKYACVKDLTNIMSGPYLRKYIKISHFVNLFALISTYSVKDSEDAWNWTFLRNCNPYFVNWPHSKMFLKLHFQGMVVFKDYVYFHEWMYFSWSPKWRQLWSVLLLHYVFQLGMQEQSEIRQTFIYILIYNFLVCDIIFALST